jgi:hypothetical protein
MNAEHPVKNMQEIVDALITDLTPYIDVDLNTIEGVVSMYALDSKWFVPIQLLLADLYLWKEDYLRAASLYYLYIYNHSVLVTSASRKWDENFERISDFGWPSFNLSTNREALFGMTYSVEKGFACPLMNKLSAKVPGNAYSTYMLKPSDPARENWDNQIFTYYNDRTREIKYKQGDLRGGPIQTINSMWIQYYAGGTQLFGGSYNYYVDEGDTMPYLNKFVNMGMFESLFGYYSSTSEIYLYRASTVYLRYAEAINRLGKPTLAYAVLKYGLKNETLLLNVDPEEINPLPQYCDFTLPFFNQNVSIRYHGLFHSEYDTTYVIPSNEAWTKEDTIKFVEDKILEELALETAFEGNRYGDLMRFSDRRNDPSILAKAVARKNPALESRLMNRANWFLPVPK